MYIRIAAGVLLLVAAALLWLLTPEGTFTVDGLSQLLAPLRDHWWGPLVSLLGMAVLLLLFLPITPLVAALVLAHGPTVAFGVGVAATVLSASLGHSIGRFVLRDSLGNQLARRLPSLGDHLQRRSLRPTLLLRMMPGLPFTLMNALAGSAGVPLRYFAAGTGLVALPLIAIAVWLAEGVIRALRSTQPAEAAWWVVGAVLLIVALVWVARRLRRSR